MEVCGCLLEVRHSASWLEDATSCNRAPNKKFSKVTMAKYPNVNFKLASAKACCTAAQPALAGGGPGQPALAGGGFDARAAICKQVQKILKAQCDPVMAVTREFGSTSDFRPIRLVADLPAKIEDADKKGLVMRILATTGMSSTQRTLLLAKVAKLGGAPGP